MIEMNRLKDHEENNNNKTNTENLINNNNTNNNPQAPSFNIQNQNDTFNNNSNNNNENKLVNATNKKEYIKYKETPSKDNFQTLNMKDNLIWKGFPLLERLFNTFFCRSKCTTNLKTKLSPIDDFLRHVSEPDPNINFLNKILSLKINKIGNIEIESNIIHPFVKVSVIDLNTLRYLQKTDFNSNSITKREVNLKVNHNKTLHNYEFKESELDYVAPFTTCPYDLRDKGESFAEWNEEFIINEDVSNIYKNSTVIFFEVLDYDFRINFSNYTNMNNSSSLSNSSSKGNNSNFIVPICWGYIKPLGYSQTYLGKQKIQLYKYKYTKPENYASERNKGIAYQRTPDVLFEFNYFKREMYQTYLEIELHLENKPSPQEIANNIKFKTQWKYICSPFYDEGDYNFNLDDEKLEKKEAKEQDDMNKIVNNVDLLKRMRNPDEPCEIPNKLLTKFSSSKLGCMTLTFSPNGRYLACACTNIDSTSTIKVFSVIDLTQKYYFKGHQELIHSLEWTSNNKILISASADFTIKFWNIPTYETSNNENFDYLDNERTFLLTSLSLPSYVYSTSVVGLDYVGVNDPNQIRILVSSACGDGYFRIHVVDFSFEDRGNNFLRFRKSALIYQYNVAEDFMFKDYSRYEDDDLKKKVKEISKRKAKSSSIIMNAENELLLNPTVLDKRFPNTIASDDLGRVYVGDSLGTMHIFEVVYDTEIKVTKIKSISHKKLEGDQINKISIDPINKQKLLIHSRDNSLRLINPYGKEAKLSIEVEFKGIKCNKTNIKSVISPDGQYILSGSEEGIPKLWHLLTGFVIDRSNNLETKFIDSVSDVSWNRHFNVIALSGFGQEYPVLLFFYEKTDREVEEGLLRMNMNAYNRMDENNNYNNNNNYEYEGNSTNYNYNNNNDNNNNNNNQEYGNTQDYFGNSNSKGDYKNNSYNNTYNSNFNKDMYVNNRAYYDKTKTNENFNTNNINENQTNNSNDNNNNNNN